LKGITSNYLPRVLSIKERLDKLELRIVELEKKKRNKWRLCNNRRSCFCLKWR